MTKITKMSLQQELVAMREERDAWKKDWATERTKREAAEESLKESREHFADLKRRVADAEAETSRLNGYLQRVHEDDIVRDGFVEIEDENGKRMVPKRAKPPMVAGNLSGFHDALHPQYDQFGRKKKATHWTSY